MTIVNRENLDVVNTGFHDLATKADLQAGTWTQWAGRMPFNGTSVDQIDVGGTPRLREWFGTRQIKDVRVYKKNFPVRKWEATIGVQVQDINLDPTGVINAKIGPFISQAAETAYEDLMYTELTSNPTGVDGTTLLSNSHSNVGGSGTSDNLSTNALSYAELKTAWQALQEMKDEYGSPLNVQLTHLLVGPAQLELALQITGSDKLVGIDDNGEIVAAGGSGVDANVAKIQNYVGGAVSVISSPEITGNEWFAMDLSKTSKPFYAYEFEGLQATSMDDATTDNVFHRDELYYGLHCRVAPVPGDWHLIYGSVTS